MTTTAPSSSHWPPAALPGSQARRVQARSNGAEYHLNLWVPAGTPPANGWPVIYVLDGNALFGTFVESIRRSARRPDATGIAPAVVVCIAQALEVQYAPEPLRRRDFTPPTQHGDGNAAAFLTFIADELAPALREELGLDAARQNLFGHSLAGFFALHALSLRPGAFHTFAAISPSIWWAPDDLYARCAALQPDATRAFIAVGEWEDSVPPWQRSAPGYDELVQRRAECRMIGHAQELSAELSKALGSHNVDFRLFPDEDHASILMVATQRFLRFALAPDEI